MTKNDKSASILAGFSRQPVEIKAGALTLAAGVLSLLVPNILFEKLSLALGIAGVLPAAAPPIGYTARAVIALMTALVAGIFAYLYFTRGNAQKQRKRFNLDAAKPADAAKSGKSLVGRLRAGLGDSLAPKATEWDAKPAADDFKPLDPERDLGPRFDESPYLQDSNLSYGEASPPAAAHRDDGGVAIDAAMTPIPAPPHADYPELELDPASTLSDPQWRTRPVEEVRENMLDLSDAELLGPASVEREAEPEVESFAHEPWAHLGVDSPKDSIEIPAPVAEDYAEDYSAEFVPEVEVAPAVDIAANDLTAKDTKDTSVQELLARLEGALVERAARRAQMRLDTHASDGLTGLERSEQDMSGALKDALSALQSASRPN